jgi:AraC family transcriptional regulator
MPKESESTWDIRDDLSFVHLYCTDEHLRDVGKRSGTSAFADAGRAHFGSDPKITALYRQFLLGCDWQQHANQLTLSTASTLLLTHLCKTTQTFSGSCRSSPAGYRRFVLRNCWRREPRATLAEAGGAGRPQRIPFCPHVPPVDGAGAASVRDAEANGKAKALVQNTATPLTDIALACGFNSASHFSNRFRSATGMTPSQLRAASA